MGYAINAVRDIYDGKNSIAMIRPPGHHAGHYSTKSMFSPIVDLDGRDDHHSCVFCIYNNVMASVVYQLETRNDSNDLVIIIDWDVHCGNGTADIMDYLKKRKTRNLQ